MNEQEQYKKAQSDVTRAHQAKLLLENPLYQEAIIAMESAMFEQFKDTKLDDKDKRHELWQRMQLMKQFQAKFEHIIKEGKKANETLTLLERAKQTLKRI
jgi:hypothetical protein